MNAFCNSWEKVFMDKNITHKNSLEKEHVSWWLLSGLISWYPLHWTSSGPHLTIKTVFPMHGNSRVKDKTVARPSYIKHGDSCAGKTTSLYWDGLRLLILFVIQYIPSINTIILLTFFYEYDCQSTVDLLVCVVGFATLVTISKTVIRVPYHTVQMTSTHLKIGYR